MATAITSLKASNARQGIKTNEHRQDALYIILRLKASNARQGIKTLEQPGWDLAGHQARLKASNARQGIKTIVTRTTGQGDKV